MIRYDVSLTEIQDRIKRKHPGKKRKDGTLLKGGWLERAAERTEKFRRAGQYDDPEGAEFWGEIKEIFNRIQHGKCAFCEAKLRDRRSQKKDGDIEHFRPKRAEPKPWPTLTTRAEDALVVYPPTVPTGNGHAGYHLLAYHPGNYILSCRTCNQDYKAAFFPIAGTRINSGPIPADYARENAYLVYPLGTSDIDPETLIEFDGIVAKPIHTQQDSSALHWRARIVIDFFDLNGRDDLREERLDTLLELYLALKAPDDRLAQRTVQRLISPDSRHTNCARSFKRLFETDPDKAASIVLDAMRLIEERQERLTDDNLAQT